MIEFIAVGLAAVLAEKQRNVTKTFHILYIMRKKAYLKLLCVQAHVLWNQQK